MYNSKYSGATVEALLDAVSGKTIYEAGEGITIVGGVISSTGGGGGGSIDEDMYNGLQKAVAKILTDQKAKNKEIDSSLAAKPSMSEIEAQFVNNNELEAALVAFMRSDAYHAIHDPQEHAIAAGLNDLDSRVTTLEQDSGGTPVDLSAYYTSAETLNQIGIASAATMTAVSQAIENEHYLTSADTQNYLTSADTQNFITSADTQSFVTTAVTSSLESRIAALEALLLVTGVNSAYTVVQMTEAEYSAATKNANTIYYVTSGATA